MNSFRLVHIENYHLPAGGIQASGFLGGASIRLVAIINKVVIVNIENKVTCLFYQKGITDEN
jgi:hypothetical protein